MEPGEQLGFVFRAPDCLRPGCDFPHAHIGPCDFDAERGPPQSSGLLWPPKAWPSTAKRQART